MRYSNIPGLADVLNALESRIQTLEQEPTTIVDGLGTRVEQTNQVNYAIHIDPTQLSAISGNPWRVIKGTNDATPAVNAIRISTNSYAWTMPEGGGNITLANVGEWSECVGGAGGATKAACETGGGVWTKKHPWITLPATANATGNLVYLEFAFEDGGGGLLDDAYAYAAAGLGAGNAKGKVFIGDFSALDDQEGADGIYEVHAGGSSADGYTIKYIRVPIALLTLDDTGDTKVTAIEQYRTTNVRLWAAGFDGVPALYPLD
jgi:hypothetical protein